MSEFLIFALVTGLAAVGLNKCSTPAAGSQVKPPHADAPFTYVMAARDTFNNRYVFNPYNQTERLYIGTAPEGALMLDPGGRPYVVGP